MGKTTVFLTGCGFAVGSLMPMPAEPAPTRLPVSVLPENGFVCFGNADFSDKMASQRAFLEAVATQTVWNVVTLSLRCYPDLNHWQTRNHVETYCRRAHELGMKVYMDTDPRLARDAFLGVWPQDCQRIVRLETASVKGGRAVVTVGQSSLGDHMTGGSTPYFVRRSRLFCCWAVKADGSCRKVCGKVVAQKPTLLTVEGEGLSADETFVVAGEFWLHSCDVFSSNLLDYIRTLMEGYSELGVDGGMRDEWGFPSTPPCMENGRGFWYSPNYAKAYREACGRDLGEDLCAFALFPEKVQKEIDCYNRLNWTRNAEIECHFYKTDKELFGNDVYVVKHPTWYPVIDWQEFRHSGLDWWAAPRDWAQGDEITPIAALLGMTKKFGSPNWMNEGYQSDAKLYAPAIWRYALVGGRMVYHGVFPPPKEYARLSRKEVLFRGNFDLLEAGALAAQTRVRLVNLVSRGAPDSPVALVFGHLSAMNWGGPHYRDWGKQAVERLWEEGWLVDLYPSTEHGSFSVTDDGYLAVGKQKYRALVLLHPDADDAPRFEAMVARAKKTFVRRISKGDESVDGICAFLSRTERFRQPAGTDRFRWMGYAYPAPTTDGTLTLLDGMRVRIAYKEGGESLGRPLDETLTLAGDMSVKFAASGLFAARAEKGELVALAAGRLRSVQAPGLALDLPNAEDVALIKVNGRWRGWWQTSSSGDVPVSLRKLTDDWVILRIPELEKR